MKIIIAAVIKLLKKRAPNILTAAFISSASLRPGASAQKKTKNFCRPKLRPKMKSKDGRLVKDVKIKSKIFSLATFTFFILLGRFALLFLQHYFYHGRHPSFGALYFLSAKYERRYLSIFKGGCIINH